MRSRSIAALCVFFAFIFVCISSAQTYRGRMQDTIPDSASAVAGTAAPATDPDAVNLTVLVNALLKKGVLTPSEVDALRVAAPESQLQLLVEVLTRKGVLISADLSAAAVPGGAPAPAPHLSRNPPRHRNLNLRNRNPPQCLRSRRLSLCACWPSTLLNPAV